MRTLEFAYTVVSIPGAIWVCSCHVFFGGPAIDLLLLDSALTADHLVVFGRSLIVCTMRRWLHTPAFATVSPEEISGSSPAEVQNFGKTASHLCGSACVLV
jgi:hypothetical protein